MEDILSTYRTITLGEMQAVRLMNRTDTKFVTSTARLHDLLELAAADYRVQVLTEADGVLPEWAGRTVLPYSTTYFDTPDYAMFYAHQRGHAGRQKLRVRSYDSSCTAFLEVKTKDNHGRTRKKRIVMALGALASAADAGVGNIDEWLTDEQRTFLDEKLRYPVASLAATTGNDFGRITLVNSGLTERLTIDLNLNFHGIANGVSVAMPGIAIVELKRDGRMPSPVVAMLNRLRIHPLGFSKYCIGSVLTNPRLRINRFKPRLRMVEKIAQL